MTELDATPEPNHFNAMQARLERDLINVQDHLENMWQLAGASSDPEGFEVPLPTLDKLIEQRDEVNEFLKRMRWMAGISLEFPTRTERREYLRANHLG